MASQTEFALAPLGHEPDLFASPNALIAESGPLKKNPAFRPGQSSVRSAILAFCWWWEVFEHLRYSMIELLFILLGLGG